MTDHRQLSKNLWTSWVGYTLRIGISFLFVPYITSTLGDSRYGVWVLVFQTINYFVLLDFGLEKALLRFVSKHLGSGQFAPINRVLNTAFNLYLAVGTTIILGACLTATFLFDFFRVDDPVMMAEGRAALIIVGVYMGLRFYLLPFAGSLGGFQRFDLSNWLHMAEDLLRAALMVALLAAGYGLIPLALAILGMSLAKQIAAIIWLRRLHPEISFSPRLGDRPTARELFDYSKITFGITLAWLVLFNTDAVFLGLMVSSAAAGIYAPGAQLMLYLRNAVNVVASPITTAVSERESRGDLDGVRRIYLKGLAYTSYLSFFLTVGVVIYARPFVALWLDPEFAGSAEVMRVLAIGSAFFVPQIVGNAVLFGIDKHALILRTALIECAFKIALSLLLIPTYGLLGMAWAAALPQLVVYVCIYPVLIARALDLTVAEVMMSQVRTGFVALFACTPLAVVLKLVIPPLDWITFLANVALVTNVGAIGAWFVLDRTDRERLIARIGFRRDA